MPRFTKADITFHSDGYRERKPAVNVKIYDSLAEGFAKWNGPDWIGDHPDTDARFTVEWIEEHVTDDCQSDYFNMACETGYEYAETDAQEIWGSHVRVYSQGRSGGWAVVDGIDDDVASWNAIAVARWGKFARWARSTADDTMARVVDMIYHNAFERWAEEESERIGSDAFAPENLRA
jgi:hypothetical protein